MGKYLIETDRFPFEFLSQLAERESWRKEIHRPVYHVHKWWAKRLGSVFRGLTLGCVLGPEEDLAQVFYRTNDYSGKVVFDPFMGSGTTVGEAHKLGFTALGRDINPVAVEAVRVGLSSLNPDRLEETFASLSRTVGRRISRLYESVDSQGRLCYVLYYFWVMRVPCPDCGEQVDLFPSWVVARNAYPGRKPEVQILCSSCGDLFSGLNTQKEATCPTCAEQFDPEVGPARGATATCRACNQSFGVLDGIARAGGGPPDYRLYGKLILTSRGGKEYLRATEDDHRAYSECVAELEKEQHRDGFRLPTLQLHDGYNTRQAMSYGFRQWRDFFNARQLLALGWLHEAIASLPNSPQRDAFLMLFSGALEFNNMFASYKGEGTGAVRHMFSHHILKPERTPIEANLWGTPKSSGSFSGLFKGRLLRAAGYQMEPTELAGATNGKRSVVCAPSFSGKVEDRWPPPDGDTSRTIYLSCGDSASTGLLGRSVDLVLTDPPFFDNVHYSELADFFYAWQQLAPRGFARVSGSTRAQGEVQDRDYQRFASKLAAVLKECHRILKDEGLLVFTYHHSRDDGWSAVGSAILDSGFFVVNSHPLKAEMSVASPKSQAKEPIQLDVAIVCRKSGDRRTPSLSRPEAAASANAKLRRLEDAGFSLSRNDRRVVLYGQLLATLRSTEDLPHLGACVDAELAIRDQRLTATSASETATKA